MQHMVVGGVLVRDRAVLLCHRRPDRRWYPDCWDLPGGHVEVGESERAALGRECREELGVVVLRASPVVGGPDPADMLLTLFAVEAWEGEPTNRVPDEHDQVCWFGAADLRDLRLAAPAYLPLLTRALGSPA